MPTESLFEDGKGSYVFVHPDPASQVYERRPVSVIRRTRDLVYLKASVPGSVREGEHVVGEGMLLLNEAMMAAPVQATK